MDHMMVIEIPWTFSPNLGTGDGGIIIRIGAWDAFYALTDKCA